MDQKKTGLFLKELRKEKRLTQEELAEKFNISSRTVSRWETGTNLPDLSILVELADFYETDIREIIDGERKSEIMNQNEKETLKKVADYAENEKQQILRRIQIIDCLGLITMIAAWTLEITDLNAKAFFYKNLQDCLYGFTFGVLIMNVLYVMGVLSKVRENPKRQRIIKTVGVILAIFVITCVLLSIFL